MGERLDHNQEVREFDPPPGHQMGESSSGKDLTLTKW